MDYLTHDDFSTDNIDPSEWDIISEKIIKEGDYVEIDAKGIIEKYLYINGELCKYFWDGSKWVFLSKELYVIR